ncbi:MAG: WbqC family protein [Marinirhabdus sp.]
MKTLLHPGYFPSIATMAIVVQASGVVFETHDNYQKQTYRNRAHIAHSNGLLLLNVPVKHAKDGKRQKTNEVQLENNFPWQAQHLKSLQSAYRTSPYFEFYEDDLLPIFERPVTHLMALNISIFNLLIELIGIETPIERSTAYYKDPPQKDLRGLINPKRGPAHIFEPYTQVFGERHSFLPNLSVLDLLFNKGPESLSYLQAQILNFEF